MRSAEQIIKAPLITEKGTLVSEKAGQFVFKVDPGATKVEIKRAIAELFQVKVRRVRTARFLGKRVRKGRITGKRADWKKAYVTLEEGETLDLLDQV